MVTMADFGQIRRTLSPGSKLVSVAGTSAVMRTSPEATLKRVTDLLAQRGYIEFVP